MTGPEHYAEAERLLDVANHVGHEDPARGDGIVQAAQVHATLATAAGSALRESMPDWTAWRMTAGTPAPPGVTR